MFSGCKTPISPHLPDIFRLHLHSTLPHTTYITLHVARMQKVPLTCISCTHLHSTLPQIRCYDSNCCQDVKPQQTQPPDIYLSAIPTARPSPIKLPAMFVLKRIRSLVSVYHKGALGTWPMSGALHWSRDTLAAYQGSRWLLQGASRPALSTR